MRIDKDLVLKVIDTRRYTFSKVDYSYKDGTQISIIDIGSHVVVAYRETDSYDNEPSDTWSHVAFKSKKAYGQKIQHKYLKAVEQTCLNIVVHLCHRQELHNKKIIFYGHSLGGALATIAGLVFKHRFPYMFSDIVISTGATRPFSWWSNTKDLGFSVFRFTNDFDWAGLVMPWFKHGTKNIQVGSGDLFSWGKPYQNNSHTHSNYVNSILEDKRMCYRV